MTNTKTSLMSNEALEAMARFDAESISNIPPRYRWDAIDARKELMRRA